MLNFSRFFSIFRLLKFSLGFLLFLLPWQTIWIYQEQFLNGVKWEYGTLGFYFTEALLWWTVVLFIVWFWKNFKFQISNFKFQINWTKDRIFLLSGLLFAVYCFLSFFLAIDSDVALQRALHIMEGFLLFLMLCIGPLVVRNAMLCFVGGAIVQSILGIWQFLVQSTFSSTILGITLHPVWESGTSIIQGEDIGRWLRAYGGFSHSNVFGGYLVISIIFTLLLLFRGIKNNELRIKIVVGIGLCLQVVALFFTFSRSAWLAFVMVILLYFCIIFFAKRSLHTTGHVLSSIILIGILVTLFFPLVQTRFGGNAVHEVASINQRVSGYEEAWGLFKLNPILGVGVGNYTRAVYELDPMREGWTYQPVHNVALLFLVELGAFGLSLFSLVVLSFLSLFFGITIFRYKDWNLKFGICFVLCLVPYVLLGLFDHYLFSSYSGIVITAVYFGIIFRFFHNISTVNTQ